MVLEILTEIFPHKESNYRNSTVLQGIKIKSIKSIKSIESIKIVIHGSETISI